MQIRPKVRLTTVMLVKGVWRSRETQKLTWALGVNLAERERWGSSHALRPQLPAACLTMMELLLTLFTPSSLFVLTMMELPTT